MFAPLTPFDANRSTLSSDWSAVLGHLQLEMNGAAWETWLKGTRFVGIEGDVAIIEAASSFHRVNLEERLHLIVLRALQKQRPGIADVQFIDPGFVEATPASATPATQASQPRSLVGSLNSLFTLDRYLGVRGNQVARTTCLGVVTGAAEGVSTVVIFAPPGLGKTHLLHGVGHAALQCGMRVASLTGEQFANHYVGAIRADSVSDFHAAVREVDLLILDDLQYLAGKPGTQKELQNTLDAVINRGGRVLMASDCPPFELGFMDRLQSRLAQGVVTTIDLFGREDRARFVSEIARRNNCSLPTWALERIAAAPAQSVRVLQGTVNNAIALERNGMLDLASLDAAIGYNILVTAATNRTPRELIDAVAKHFASSYEEIIGRGRQLHTRNARAVVVALLRKRGMTQPQVAKVLGDRDRTSIRDMEKTGAKLLAEDPALQRFSA